MKKFLRWYFHGDLADYGHAYFCRNCNGFFPASHFSACNPSDHEAQLALTERELLESPDRWHPANAVNLFRGNPRFTALVSQHLGGGKGPSVAAVVNRSRGALTGG